MHMIWTLIVGFFVGLIARFLMPGNNAAGFIVTIILGIVGAFLAEFIGQYFHLYTEGQSAGFIASIVGAMIVLFIYRLIIGRRGTP